MWTRRNDRFPLHDRIWQCLPVLLFSSSDPLCMSARSLGHSTRFLFLFLSFLSYFYSTLNPIGPARLRSTPPFILFIPFFFATNSDFFLNRLSKHLCLYLAVGSGASTLCSLLFTVRGVGIFQASIYFSRPTSCGVQQ